MSESTGLIAPALAPEALAAWSGGVWRGAPHILTGASNDSRTLSKGDLFFALRGEGADGHDYLAAAFAAGAGGAVVARGRLREPLPGACLEVDDPALALRRMAFGYRRALQPLMVGVTGSVGKTTVKEMIAETLSAQGPVARTRGNWNNDIGLPLSLLSMPRQTKVGVFEIGMSHPGELAPLCALLEPEIGAITRIGPVHLEFFDSIEAIAREKALLLHNLPSNGFAVLNPSDPYYPILRKASAARVVTAALEQPADYSGVFAGDGNRLLVRERGGVDWELIVPLPGRHNAENAMLAAAVGRERGLEPGAIRAALERARLPPMRWDIFDLNGVKIVNDAYNANPLSMRAALAAFALGVGLGRRWLVLGGMRELGRTETAAHQELGREIAAGPWAGLVVVGRRGAMIAEAAKAAGMEARKIFICENHAAAAFELAALTQPGDTALFKASRGERLENVIALWRETGQKKGSV